jgi:hypothetical protein
MARVTYRKWGRELTHDFPLLFEHKDWRVSPALRALLALPEVLADTGPLSDDGASRYAPPRRTRPAEVWRAAIIGALLSGAGAAWWARRANLTRQAGPAWRLAGLLLGMPAWLSLMAPQPRKLDSCRPAGVADTCTC